MDILILYTLSGVMHRLSSKLLAFRQATQARLQKARARREFDRLDDRALKDLGICRSEFDSVWAESRGREQTRRRLSLDGRSGVWP
jgi:uncharacterized protein YjiS (DUF1127 family)